MSHTDPIEEHYKERSDLGPNILDGYYNAKKSKSKINLSKDSPYDAMSYKNRLVLTQQGRVDSGMYYSYVTGDKDHVPAQNYGTDRTQASSLPALQEQMAGRLATNQSLFHRKLFNPQSREHRYLKNHNDQTTPLPILLPGSSWMHDAIFRNGTQPFLGDINRVAVNDTLTQHLYSTMNKQFK
jgi:hypothetical protein